MLGYSEAECLILLASDSIAVRNHWKQALLPALEVCETWTFEGLQRSMVSLKPSVLLLDENLPGLNASEDVAELLKLSSTSKIIVCTSFTDERSQIKILRLGARGFLHRETDPILLRRAVEIVRKGEIWASRRIISRLLD